MRVKALCAVALLSCLCACTSDGRSAKPSASRAKPPTVTMLAQHVTLVPGRQAPVVFVIDAATSAAQIIVNHDPSAHIDVYLLPSAAMPAKECPIPTARSRQGDCVRDIGTGVRETLDRSGPARAVALVLRSGPPAVDIRLDYDEGGRGVGIKLPRIAPLPGASVCKDNGCNPFFEISPLHSGPMTARARFAGGPALMQVLAGRVIARSFSATGFPYRVAAEDRGSGTLSVSTQLDAPAEYALALSNDNPSVALTGITLDVGWP